MMQTAYAFLGSRIRKTGENLSAQVAKILREHISDIDPRAVPVLKILNENNSASISELSDKIGFTHPAIIQLVNKLERDKLVTVNKSRSDKRMTILQLTFKGKDTFKKLEPIISDIEEVVESIINDIDANLSFSLLEFDRTVKSGLLLKKLNDKTKLKAMNEVAIIPYKKKYKSDFRRLNEEWILKYFEIEDKDKQLLLNPEKEIIDNGGQIFFALLDVEIVGTCAMMKLDNSTFELGKMAVTEKAQGKQIGKKLLLTSIGFAVEEGAKKVVLSTHPKLTVAVNLYQSIGFKKMNIPKDSTYKRAVFTMELDLTSE